MPPALPRSAIVLLFIGIVSGNSLPPPDAHLTPPPTLPQIWANTDAIVYGSAVRVEVDATKEHTIRYNSTFRVER